MHNQLINAVVKKLEVLICIILLLISDPLHVPFPRFLENIISSIYYGFLFFIIIRRWKNFLYVATRDKSLLLLCSVAVMSFLWSANPSNTIDQARTLLRSTVLGVYLAMDYTPKKQIQLLYWTMGISTVITLVTCLLFPSFGTQAINGGVAWTGIYGHKQILGRQAGLAVSLVFINFLTAKKNKLIVIIEFFLTFTVVLFCKSKTSLLLVVFCCLLIPLYKFVINQRQAKLIFFLIFLLFYSILAIILSINIEYIVVDLLGKDLAFDGRVPLWNLAIEKGLEQPWLGYGYEGFWSSPNVSDYVIYNSWAVLDEGFRNHSVQFHSHNGFIDLFLELGFVGVCIFLLNVFLSLKRIITLLISTRGVEFYWMLQFLGIFWIANLAEGGLVLSSRDTFWIIYVSIVISSAVEQTRINKFYFSRESNYV